MSCILQIWQQPAERALPASVDEAHALVMSLQRRLPVDNARYIALAERLTRVLPEYPGQEDEGSGECAGSDAPLDGMTLRAVFTLVWTAAMVEHSRALVLNEAIALGLCVLDEQAAELWLPDGRVISQPTVTHAATQAPTMASPQRTPDSATSSLFSSHGMPLTPSQQISELKKANLCLFMVIIGMLYGFIAATVHTTLYGNEHLLLPLLIKVVAGIYGVAISTKLHDCSRPTVILAFMLVLTPNLLVDISNYLAPLLLLPSLYFIPLNRNKMEELYQDEFGVGIDEI